MTTTRGIELLAPAGGPEAFNAALAAGADAIYCGLGNNFNARRSAHNFTEETFGEACRRAHLAGARVYVTVNIAVATREIPQVLELIRRAWLLGADAFIIQDWGLLAEVRRSWPEIECHVSTQANVHDARGTVWCRELGVARVTLSRELSLKEMRTIAREGVELEAFGHGALCFCYSGVCMMSSLAGGRSANRGLCAQPCRLPYDLVDEAGRAIEAPGRTRPLCPKDYCVVDDLPRLMDAGVASLKVEGRMKSPDYVYAVISAYRRALDALAAGEKDEKSDAARHRTLRRVFNRDFTDAYLWGRSGDEMMSYERSNNRGELVGEVVSSRRLEDTLVRCGGSDGGRERMRRLTRADVEIRLDQPVGEGDLLELRPVEDPSQFLTVRAERAADAGETISCRASRPVPAGSVVRVIRSQAAMDAAARVAGLDVPRRRPVTVGVRARLGEPFSVMLSCADGSATATVEGFVVEAARTKAVTREDLIEHVGRMGQCPFEPVSFEVEIDEGVGMGFSAVHKVRSKACDALEQQILLPYETRGKGLSVAPSARGVAARLTEVREKDGLAAPDSWTRPVPEACALVATADAARAAFEAGAARIYAMSDALEDGSTWPEGVIPWLDEVCREGDHARLDPWVRAGQPVGVGNVSELALAASRGALPEIRTCIPVHNESSIVALESAGAVGFWLSPELTLEEVCSLAGAASVPVGLVVSGRACAMTSEHCVLQAAGRCIHDCPNCELRRRRLSLRDIDGNLLPVRTDVHGRSRIWAAHPLDATPQADALVAAGVTRLMANATLLSPEECTFAVERVVRALAAVAEGKRPAPRVQGATSGHLFTGIG